MSAACPRCQHPAHTGHPVCCSVLINEGSAQEGICGCNYPVIKPSVFSTPVAELSLKRIAWAYGCAKAGSEEEARLEVVLLAKVYGCAPEVFARARNAEAGQ